MTDMITRAAKAAYDAFDEGPTFSYQALARRALLAALDPEDEALVEVVRKARDEAAWRGFDQAAAIIRAIKRMAQGGQSS